MKDFLNSPLVFAEINPACLRVLSETTGVEFSLQRGADGKLTPACRKDVASGLRNFLGRQSWQPRVRAICAISAHGVSLRTVPLPSGEGDLQDIMRLQIEKEFPLAPEELAWGWRQIFAPNGARQALVAAVRRQVVEDYAELFSDAGIRAEFALAACAREWLCPAPDSAHVSLDVQPDYVEMALFESGAAASVRIFSSVPALVEALRLFPAKTIYLSGNAPQDGIIEKLPARVAYRALEVPGGAGVSAATIGLKKAVSENAPVLKLQAKSHDLKTPFSFSRADFLAGRNRLWLIRAVALLLALLLLPYAEALLFKPLLALKLNSVKNHRRNFVSLAGPELAFLQSLRQEQPPYLDALYVMAQAAPPGLSITSLTMDQKGDVALKASLQSAQQVMDFRSKLIASGFFANITVEDQTPLPNEQKVNVRMTARWKTGARAIIKMPPPTDQKSSVPPGPAPGVVTRL